MKTLGLWALFITIGSAIIFGAAAFVELQINPADWRLQTRVLAAGSAVFWAMVAVPVSGSFED